MPSDSKKIERDQAAVPMAVINRLSLYLRELQQMLKLGRNSTSSSNLGQKLGCSDAQVRKDLAYFGQFGRPGIGYQCEELITAIRKILGTDQNWPVLLVGAGNLGRALLGYKGFIHQGFQLVAAVDVSPEKIGMKIEGVPIEHLDDLAEIVARESIRLGIIAVPGEFAQKVANQLVAAGLEGIVNFAPVTLSLPEGVSHLGVDLAMQLEQISFSVASGTRLR